LRIVSVIVRFNTEEIIIMKKNLIARLTLFTTATFIQIVNIAKGNDQQLYIILMLFTLPGLIIALNEAIKTNER
jgi:hypothetical protein